MPITTTYTKSSKNTVIEALTKLPRNLVNRNSSANRKMLQEVGLVILKLIRKAFITKSLGGTDEAGDRWQPLSQTTINKRKKTKSKSSQSNNAAVRRIKNIIQSKVGREEYILFDSGALLDSLSPNSNSPYQIFKIDNGRVIIGTTRPGAMRHHEGIPGKLPQRRLWPDPNNWPASWWDKISKKLTQGVVDNIIESVT